MTLSAAQVPITVTPVASTQTRSIELKAKLPDEPDVYDTAKAGGYVTGDNIYNAGKLLIANQDILVPPATIDLTQWDSVEVGGKEIYRVESISGQTALGAIAPATRATLTYWNSDTNQVVTYSADGSTAETQTDPGETAIVIDASDSDKKYIWDGNSLEELTSSTGDLWSTSASTTITDTQLSAVDLILKINIDDTTPAGGITVGTLTAANVGKEIWINNLTATTRTFTPTNQAINFAGTVVPGWSIPGQQFFAFQLRDDGDNGIRLHQFSVVDGSVNWVELTSAADENNGTESIEVGTPTVVNRVSQDAGNVLITSLTLPDGTIDGQEQLLLDDSPIDNPANTVLNAKLFISTVGATGTVVHSLTIKPSTIFRLIWSERLDAWTFANKPSVVFITEADSPANLTALPQDTLYVVRNDTAGTAIDINLPAQIVDRMQIEAHPMSAANTTINVKLNDPTTQSFLLDDGTRQTTDYVISTGRVEFDGVSQENVWRVKFGGAAYAADQESLLPHDEANSSVTPEATTKTISGSGVRPARLPFTGADQDVVWAITEAGNIVIEVLKHTNPFTIQLREAAKHANNLTLDLAANGTLTVNASDEIELSDIAYESENYSDYWKITYSGARPRDVDVRIFSNIAGDPTSAVETPTVAIRIEPEQSGLRKSPVISLQALRALRAPEQGEERMVLEDRTDYRFDTSYITAISEDHTRTIVESIPEYLIIADDGSGAWLDPTSIEPNTHWAKSRNGQAENLYSDPSEVYRRRLYGPPINSFSFEYYEPSDLLRIPHPLVVDNFADLVAGTSTLPEGYTIGSGTGPGNAFYGGTTAFLKKTTGIGEITIVMSVRDGTHEHEIFAADNSLSLVVMGPDMTTYGDVRNVRINGILADQRIIGSAQIESHNSFQVLRTVEADGSDWLPNGKTFSANVTETFTIGDLRNVEYLRCWLSSADNSNLAILDIPVRQDGDGAYSIGVWLGTEYLRIHYDDIETGLVRISSRSATKNLHRVQYIANAANGFVIPTGTILAQQRKITLIGGLGTINGATVATVLEGVPTMLKLDLNPGQRIATKSISDGVIDNAMDLYGYVSVTAGALDAVITITEAQAETYRGLQRIGDQYRPDEIDISNSVLVTGLDLTRPTGSLVIQFSDAGQTSRPWPKIEIDLQELREANAAYVWNHDDSYIDIVVRDFATGEILITDSRRSARFIYAEVVDFVENGYSVPSATLSPRTLPLVTESGSTLIPAVSTTPQDLGVAAGRGGKMRLWINIPGSLMWYQEYFLTRDEDVSWHLGAVLTSKHPGPANNNNQEVIVGAPDGGVGTRVLISDTGQWHFAWQGATRKETTVYWEYEFFAGN